MIQKKRHITEGRQYLLGLIAAVGAVLALWCQSFVSLADSTGIVTAGSAKIRAGADTSSTAIGSVNRGVTVSITDEVQDSSGMLWYQVYVDGNTTGYIRSDLVEKQSDDEGTGAIAGVDTVLDAQYGSVSPETIMVRKGPSTNESVVDRLANGTQVIISGESQGNDGKKWYYVSFTGTDGEEKTGFIRSDLLSLGDMVPVPEEAEEIPEPQETEPEPEVLVNNDYELTYEQNVDGSGTYEHYLYDYSDHENAKKYRLSDLMEATKARSESDAADAKTLVRQRIAIVVLILLVVVLVVLVVVMALKLRDVYYEDYEDEDEEEQEETPPQRRRRSQETEETGAQRRRRTEEAEETPTQRRRRTQEVEETSSRRRRRVEDTDDTARRKAVRDKRGSGEREVEYREDDAGSAPVKTAPKRKPKNFLVDDDEFEFEFLNMEDKD